MDTAKPRLDLGFRHLKLGPGKNSFARKSQKLRRSIGEDQLRCLTVRHRDRLTAINLRANVVVPSMLGAGSCYIDGYFGLNTFIGILKKVRFYACFAKFFRWYGKKFILFCFHRFSLQEKVFKTFFFCSLAPLVFSVPIIRYAAQTLSMLILGQTGG